MKTRSPASGWRIDLFWPVWDDNKSISCKSLESFVIMRDVTGRLLKHLGSGCDGNDGMASQLVQQQQPVRDRPGLAEFLRGIRTGRVSTH